MASKQKMLNFGPFDPSYLRPFEVHPIKQKMKTVVMIDGMLEGMHVKTRVLRTNVANNRWVQNVKNVSASLMPFPMWRKNKWVRNKNYMPRYFPNSPRCGNNNQNNLKSIKRVFQKVLYKFQRSLKANILNIVQIELSSSSPEPKNDKKDEICEKLRTDEDDLITENFESGFGDSLEPILGIEKIIGVISLLPVEFEQEQNIEYSKEDYFDAFLRHMLIY